MQIQACYFRKSILRHKPLPYKKSTICAVRRQTESNFYNPAHGESQNSARYQILQVINGPAQGLASASEGWRPVTNSPVGLSERMSLDTALHRKALLVSRLRHPEARGSSASLNDGSE